ncbi:MAG: AbrB/MazE/SpoVT family DNA-binding domain-containing protein [Terriglobia bacterium]|jgi:AbrB family looped-hinge helix DNA binding protein
MQTAYITSKGQLVVPAKLRRKYNIKPGTRINFIEEEGGRIVMQPITPETLRSLRGILKLKGGEKSATRQLLEDRAGDRRREEARLAKHRPR